MENIEQYRLQVCTNLLIQIFENPILNEIVELWEFSKKNYIKTHSNPLLLFQDKLEEIMVWNRVQIHESFEKVKKKNSEDYINKLVDIVYKLSVKVLLDSDYCIKIPDNETFYHQCLVSSAGKIFHIPTILQNGKPQDILGLIKKSINDTIQKNVMKESLLDAITQQCVGTEEAIEEDDIEDDIEETESIKKENESVEEPIEPKEGDVKSENSIAAEQEAKIEERAEGDFSPPSQISDANDIENEIKKEENEFKSFDNTDEKEAVKDDIHLRDLFNSKADSNDKLTVKLT